jgi:hypothetical protein
MTYTLKALASGLVIFVAGTFPASAAFPSLETVNCVKSVLSGFSDTVSVDWSPVIFRTYTDPTTFTRGFWPVHYVYRSPDGTDHSIDFYVAGGDLNDYDLVGFPLRGNGEPALVRETGDRTTALAHTCNVRRHHEGPAVQ